jgi:GNAT superfamily N-acetyltransferase
MLKPTKKAPKSPKRRTAATTATERPGHQPAISARAIKPADWQVIEQLFGPNGACGGCWCMTWRVPRGGKLWEEVKGEKNKQAFKKLVQGGKVFGVLAFADGQPVGWCSVGPRGDFARLTTIKSLQIPWTPATWSVTCFFIRSPWRRKGVATALLAEAVKVAKANGAKELEAYPVKLYTDSVPAAFAWTGIPILFEKEKFVDVTPPGNSRPIYRKTFRSARSAT